MDSSGHPHCICRSITLAYENSLWSMVSVTFGLLANSGEGAGVFRYFLLGLLFISSAFAPTESMPGVVRAFAEHQPMTPIIGAVRALMMHEPVGDNVLIAVIWCLGILIVFYIAARQINKRKQV